MYLVTRSNTFKKSVIRQDKSGELPNKKVREVIKIIATGNKLSAKYKDHKLTGYFEGYRECHIKHNLLLIYKIDESENLLVLINIGTHSQLFGK